MRAGQESWFVAVVLLLFVGLAAWALSSSGGALETAYPPYSTVSPKPAGLKAAFEVLDGLGYKPQKYGDTVYHYPDNSCMVLATEYSPDFSSMMGDLVDVKQLRLWLKKGGRLVLACDREAPFASNLFTDELVLPEANTYSAPPDCAAKRTKAGATGQLTAVSRVFRPGDVYELGPQRPRLWAGVQSIEVASAGASGTSKPGMPTLLGLYDPVLMNPQLDPLVLQQPVGKGEILWLTTPELLTNKWLARADNRKLMLALLSYATRPAKAGGAALPLYFDESIHGFGFEGHNPVSLLTQTTGGRLLLLAALCAVTLFLGAAIRPARFLPQGLAPRRAATEMVLAQADLYRRAGARFSLAESLLEGLKRAWMHSRHSSAMPSDRALLDFLQKEQVAEPALLEYLQSKILPPIPRRLLELTQACDRVRLRFDNGSL